MEMESGTSFSVIGFIFTILAFLVLIYCWRLLNRWNRHRTFKYWFPTVMLAGASLVLWSSDWIDSSSFLGIMFEYFGYFFAGLNIPVLLMFGVVTLLLPENLLEVIPGSVRIVLFGSLYWLSWYMFLHILKTLELEKSPKPLNLSIKSKSSSNPEEPG